MEEQGGNEFGGTLYTQMHLLGACQLIPEWLLLKNANRLGAVLHKRFGSHQTEVAACKRGIWVDMETSLLLLGECSCQGASRVHITDCTVCMLAFCGHLLRCRYLLHCCSKCTPSCLHHSAMPASLVKHTSCSSR